MLPADALIAELRAEISDPRVLDAIATVPRELFVPPAVRADAWRNGPLPIGEGQTISQPLVVARMCELLELRGDERVLDVGTGSGYHAAVLAQLAAHVWSIERHPSLSLLAGRSLDEAGVGNVTLTVGDGARGIPAQAPFDAINVAAAAAPRQLSMLESQIAAGGRMIAPVGARSQRLVVVERRPDGGLTRTDHERVRFVPLIS